MARFTTRLRTDRDDFLERWAQAVGEAGIQYSGIISEDILVDGAQVYEQLVAILERPNYQIGPRKRINPIGKRLGARRAMTGVALEATLELFILFRHVLWESLPELLADDPEADLLEVRRRIDLYLDQLIASIAYAYTSTKEKAMVGLIEKLLS